MLLGNGFLPMFASGSGLALTGATWALDGSGRAYNTPVLGSELLTDGGLENWTTATNLTSWTESVAGTSTVNRESTVVNGGTYSARLDVDAGNSNVAIRQDVIAIGQWYQVDLWARATAASKSFSTDSGIFATTTATSGAWGRHILTGRCTLTTFNIKRGTATSASLYFDDISCKLVPLSTTLATIAGSANNLTATAKIHTLPTGTPAGVGALIDSTSNPQNFLIAYHNGASVLLDKCVAGTYTNLITATVAFSSNAQIEIRRPSGNTFQLWYNGSQRGTDQTVSDAGIISNTLYGLFSTYSGNLFSEFSLGGVVIPFGF